jgi:D-glycerate 3-kinase
MTSIDLTAFLEKHRLPASYNDIAHTWFIDLAASIVSHQKMAGRPIVVGINGAQGSGKSTLTDLLVYLLTTQHHVNAVGLSIDDFYLTKAERRDLANQVHPLFSTRGVPGTHDTELAETTIQYLSEQKHSVTIPRFNKAMDDRYPISECEHLYEKIDVIFLEGWCVGALPVDDAELTAPINELEANQDPNGEWRQYANMKLSTDYQSLFNMIDLWVMLKAPSFDCVYAWRLEQEHKLRDASLSGSAGVMSDEQVAFFIQHYQRITESILASLPNKVDFLFELDDKRNIINSTSKG